MATISTLNVDLLLRAEKFTESLRDARLQARALKEINPTDLFNDARPSAPLPLVAAAIAALRLSSDG